MLRQLSVLVVPICPEQLDFAARRPVAAIVVRNPESPLALSTESIATPFELTSAEARLVAAFVEQASLKTAAAHLAISHQTAPGNLNWDTPATATPLACSTRSDPTQVARLAPFVAKHCKLPRGFGWKVVAFVSPNRLGRISLEAECGDPAEHRVLRDRCQQESAYVGY